MSSKESWMTLKCGYLGWDTFERRIDGLKESALQSNGALLSCDLLERVSVYGFVGGVQIDAKRGGLTYCSRTGLGGAVGISALACEQGMFSLGGALSYFQASAPLRSPFRRSLFYREWQASCAVACKTPPFYPYLGLRYARALLRLPSLHPATYASQIPAGMFMGVTYAPATTFALSLEAGLINEYSLSFLLTARL